MQIADKCTACHGEGGEKGSSIKPCGTCGGRGQIIRSRGIFSVAQTCPDCAGTRLKQQARFVKVGVKNKERAIFEVSGVPLRDSNA